MLRELEGRHCWLGRCVEGRVYVVWGGGGGYDGWNGECGDGCGEDR